MSSHSSMRRQPSMMTVSTFISTRMSSSGGLSPAPNSNSPSVQLKKLKAVSWICSRTACSSVSRSMRPCSRRMPPEARAVRGLLLRGERLLELRVADGAGLDEPLAERQQLRRGVGVGDHPVAEEDLARLAVPADGERAALGAHLHELEDVGETELLQVALEKHRPPFAGRRLADGPRRVARPRNLHRQRGRRLEDAPGGAQPAGAAARRAGAAAGAGAAAHLDRLAEGVAGRRSVRQADRRLAGALFDDPAVPQGEQGARRPWPARRRRRCRWPSARRARARAGR